MVFSPLFCVWSKGNFGSNVYTPGPRKSIAFPLHCFLERDREGVTALRFNVPDPFFSGFLGLSLCNKHVEDGVSLSYFLSHYCGSHW